MHTKTRLVSVTMLQQFNHETVEGLDFSTVENSGEIEVVAELFNDEKSVLVSVIVNDLEIFKKEIDAFESWAGK